jgi:hypothetical protein
MCFSSPTSASITIVSRNNAYFVNQEEGKTFVLFALLILGDCFRHDPPLHGDLHEDC